VNTNLYMTALNDVKKRMQDGAVPPCTTTYGIAKQKELGFSDIQLAYALSTPWAAGIGTVSSMAMLHFPECVREVQGEIDAVVGRDRLPTFEDQQSLPYTDAEDNTYHGMFIPKGIPVYTNAAAITHDPTVFPDPHTFKPERFIETTDPRLINHKFGCFGFGRRVCPGIHVALQSLYIVISRFGQPPANLKYRLVPRFENVKELVTMEA
ncbi:cytochrome P450, partial [Rhodocollybia butyracea]